MKKVILGVLIFISAMACSDVNINEENLIKENGSIEKLTKDKNFIIINEEMKSFSIYIEAVIKNQELTSSELISKINDIVNSQFSEQEQLLHLNKLFKTDITNRVINNGQIISLNLAVLNSKYENIDEKLLTDVFNSNLINDKKNLNLVIEKKSVDGGIHFASELPLREQFYAMQVVIQLHCQPQPA